MASLRQEHRYGLCCGKTTRSSPNISLYHVKLTDTAIRALEAYQNIKGVLQNQTSICFKGNHGATAPDVSFLAVQRKSFRGIPVARLPD
uniref:RNA polymerase II elongation factor ELL N-terminal domain-containing protein n=1 Tax=Cyprinodon variegatus TaxID=28743 RepID=A0A3Q2DIJ3_CYPVA